jgi:beta-mannosidase
LDPNAAYSLKVNITRKTNNASISSGELSVAPTSEQLINYGFKTPLPWDLTWWTWDLGLPNLIVVTLTLTNLNTSEVTTSSMTTGFRTVKVIQEAEKGYTGTSFKVNLNGYDIYMRGGNYIPAEMSLARTNAITYQKVVEDALFGRFNMIRLWGGGQFEKDEFYSAMDEAGILIWHDLMFACALYPSSEEILANIEAEMRDNVRRIRHHPSMAIWNGNNEVWIGWQEWGWKHGLTDAQRNLVESMYSDVFKVVLPKVLAQEHP